MEKHYYEVEFGNWKNLEDLYSICIVGIRKPTLKEAEEFCKKDMVSMGYEYVNDVEEISGEEAHKFFDMENENDYPVFGQ